MYTALVYFFFYLQFDFKTPFLEDCVCDWSRDVGQVPGLISRMSSVRASFKDSFTSFQLPRSHFCGLLTSSGSLGQEEAWLSFFIQNQCPSLWPERPPQWFVSQASLAW